MIPSHYGVQVMTIIKGDQIHWKSHKLCLNRYRSHYICCHSICYSRFFSSFKKFRAHAVNHKMGKLKCDRKWCGMTFNCIHKLIVHVRKFHRPKSEVDKSRPIQESKNFEASNDSPKNLQGDESIVHVEKICDTTSTSKLDIFVKNLGSDGHCHQQLPSRKALIEPMVHEVETFFNKQKLVPEDKFPGVFHRPDIFSNPITGGQDKHDAGAQICAVYKCSECYMASTDHARIMSHLENDHDLYGSAVFTLVSDNTQPVYEVRCCKDEVVPVNDKTREPGDVKATFVKKSGEVVGVFLSPDKMRAEISYHDNDEKEKHYPSSERSLDCQFFDKNERTCSDTSLAAENVLDSRCKSGEDASSPKTAMLNNPVLKVNDGTHTNTTLMTTTATTTVKAAVYGAHHMCRGCNGHFLRIDALQTHLSQSEACNVAHNGYVCRKCARVFEDMVSLKIHRYIDHGSLCTDCGDTLRLGGTPLCHVCLTKNAKSLTANICSICGKSFDCFDSLRLHRDVDHGEFCVCCGVFARLKMQYLCRGCSDMNVSVPLSLPSMVDALDKTTCKLCSATFSTSKNLARHMAQRHSGELCIHCGESPRQQGHISCLNCLRKATKRPWNDICRNCNRAFNAPSHLASHMKWCKKDSMCISCDENSPLSGSTFCENSAPAANSGSVLQKQIVAKGPSQKPMVRPKRIRFLRRPLKVAMTQVMKVRQLVPKSVLLIVKLNIEKI